MQRVLLLSAVLLSLIASSMALRCYTCSNQPECLNPTASMETACTISTDPNDNVCYKTITGLGTTTTGIQRGCGRPTGTGTAKLNNNECQDIDISGAKMSACLCDTRNLCNSAGSSKISLAATGISVLFAMIVTKFL